MNKVILMGHLGADPEVRYLPNGDAACSFRIATNTRWKDKDTGEMKEHTEWHSCSMFGKRGESFAKHVKKGHRVLVEGEMRTRKWQDKEGIDRWTTEVRVRDFEFAQSLGAGQRPPAAEADRPDPEGSATAPRQTVNDKPPGDFDDDIPF